MDRIVRIASWGLVFVILNAPTWSQSERSDSVISAYLTYLEQELSESGQDPQELTEILVWRIEHPLDLNAATYEQLDELGILHPYIIESILIQRKETEGFATIYELLSIEGMDQEVIQHLSPFIFIGDGSKESFSARFKNARHELWQRYAQSFPTSEGMRGDSTHYLGSPHQHYLRYRMSDHDLLSMGITLEKDKGEPYHHPSHRLGSDFVSAHFQLGGLGVIHDLVIGDFQAGFGQGLCLNSGFGMGPSFGSGLRRRETGLRPYTASNENRFLRGVGATLRLGSWDWTLLGSMKRVDGNLIDEDTLNIAERISSFQNSGYHRSESELSDMDAIGELLSATRLRFRHRVFSVGATAVLEKLALPGSSGFLSAMEWESDLNLRGGLDFTLVLKHLEMFGEISLDPESRTSWILGASILASDDIQVDILTRHFPWGVENRYEQSWSQGNSNENETGGLLRIHWEMGSQWKLLLSGDLAHHPRPSYQTDAPHLDQEWLGQVEFHDRGIQAYLRQTFRSRPENYSSQQNPLDRVIPEEHLGTRLHLSWKVSPVFEWRNRVEYHHSRHGEHSSHGWLCYSELVSSWEKAHLKFYLRYGLFDTQTYVTRIYAYENEPLYQFYIPMHHGRGSRSYLMLKFAPVRWFNLWVKAGLWYYPDQESIGSGYDEIAAPWKLDLKVQTRFRF